jgi:biotin carboxyl carrier protein
LTLDGTRHLAWVAADGSRRWVALQGNASRPLILAVPEARGRQRRSAAGQAGALEAQMPGVVRRVLVAAGEAVERGQALLLLEAMKMEIRVSAPQAGVVQQVEVTEGEAVERGQSLVTLVTSEQSE